MFEMSTLAVLLSQADTELSKSDPDLSSDLWEQLQHHLHSSIAWEEFDELVFGAVPTVVRAGTLFPSYEDQSMAILDAAATFCTPRDLFTSIAAVLVDPQLPNLSQRMQRTLLLSLVRAATRICRKREAFLSELLHLATCWCRNNIDNNPNETINSYIDLWKSAFDGFCGTEPGSDEESKSHDCAVTALHAAALQVAGMALQHEPGLEKAGEAFREALPEVEATFIGKLARIEGVVRVLLWDAERVLSLLCYLSKPRESDAASTETRVVEVKNLKDLVHQRLGLDEQDAQHMLHDGFAAMFCAAILQEGTTNATSSLMHFAVPHVDDVGTTLDALLIALRSLTSAAARHQSVPLAIVPLLAAFQVARRQAISGSLLNQSHTHNVEPILSTLVDIMSLNPIQIVRTCAYEALQSLLDASEPSARMVTLQHMLAMESMPAVAVALQRLRLEISTAELQAPFTREAVLELCLPWLRQGDGERGWRDESDVVSDSDVLGAAATLLRFVVLQVSAIQTGARQAQKAPLLESVSVHLRPENLQNLLENDLRPLHTCVSKALKNRGDFTSGQLVMHGGSTGTTSPNMLMTLGLMRLEETLDATVQAAASLI